MACLSTWFFFNDSLQPSQTKNTIIDRPDCELKTNSSPWFKSRPICHTNWNFRHWHHRSPTVQRMKTEFTATIRHYAVLLSVPIIWGTYGPLLQRFILTTPLPIPFYNFFSFLACYVFLRKVSSRTESLPYSTSNACNGQLWRSGAELGTWLFCGSTCLAYGLQSTSASRAAIILSMKSVFVSLLECIRIRQWPRRVNICTCIAAVCGVWYVASPPGDTHSTGDITSDYAGSLLVLVASCFYSFHVFRLGILSKQLGSFPLSLAVVKVQVMCGLTLVLIGIQWCLVPSLSAQYSLFVKDALEMTSLIGPTSAKGLVGSSHANIFPPQIWAAALCVLWNGCVNVGYSMWAQLFAQKHISSTAASFAYASTPVSTFFWSWVLDVGGVMSTTNTCGGMMLMAAVVTQLSQLSWREKRQYDRGSALLNGYYITTIY